MPAASALSFSSPFLGLAALALALTAIGIARYRRISPPALSAGLFVAGMLAFSLAAAGPLWNHPKPGAITVMVDLSPSTRGAHFRDPNFLRQRLNQLIGDAPHQLLAFAAENRPLDPSGPFDEIPADRTVFSPPASDAIVLFSDARFDLPEKSPTIYIEVDDGLENVADASVQSLEIQGQTLAAKISNSGPPRLATFPDATVPISAGKFIVTRPIPTGSQSAAVKLNPADLWPENDSLSIKIAPPIASEFWWIGPTPPNKNWRQFSPQNIPEPPEQYLAPAAIVLDNQPGDFFSPAQLFRLDQYIRDLGGSVLILGGDRAFASGNYPGTILEQISPLASSPPTPTTQWICITDASGSMAQDSGAGITRWQAATQAVVHLLPALPPADPVLIGQFSDSVRWWLPPQPAADAAKISLPPADAFPHGPTNLESSLIQIADQSNSNLPTQLLLVSDCDATIQNPTELTRRLQARKISLNVLAIDRGSALDIIRQIARDTGGSVIEQSDPRQWIESAKKLSRAALPQRLEHQPINCQFIAGAKSLPEQSISEWNRTWLKPQADLWAASAAEPGIPFAAFWPVGLGNVAATAFQPNTSAIDSIITYMARKPRDPRFSVQWETGPKSRVIVDAVESGAFLNDLPLAVDLTDNSAVNSIPLTQTAPGRYEADFDTSRDFRLAALRINNEIIDRAAIPGRYPSEFDAVGNDHDAMRKLAESTGGQIIWPADRSPINFHWPTATTSLAPWLCQFAFLSIAIALMNWRLKRSNPGAY